MTRAEEYDVSKLAEVIDRKIVPTVYGWQMCRRATIEPVTLDGDEMWRVMLYGEGGNILSSFTAYTPAAAIKWMLKPVQDTDEESWVNVNDRLPPYGVPCWTCDLNKVIRRSRLDRDSPSGSLSEPWWQYERGGGCPASNRWVTRWMLDRKPEGPVEA